jgi:prolyl-tRNA synthetase
MRQTQLFSKTRKSVSKEETSLNAQLLIRAGYIDRLASGIYSMLPLGNLVLSKIENIIRKEMNEIGGQEILMPAMHPKQIWEQTGRWASLDVLFKLSGNADKEYALGATHEEVITPLAQKNIVSYKDLPAYLYQIQTKFRDEPRAKSGILRCKEFRMKDLYSFHSNETDLDNYYEIVKKAYFKIFELCGLGKLTHLTYASGGSFSKYSHEFQTLSETGEDTIYLCEKCGTAVNKEIFADIGKKCPECNGIKLNEQKAIEVGNIFKLKTKYSQAFDFDFIDENGKKQPVIMGCYGIGPSRLIGAIAEISNDSAGLIWPKNIAPFDVHLVSLSASDEDTAYSEALYNKFLKKGIETLYDDRPVGAGEKFADSDLIGIPIRIIISKKTIDKNKIEVKNRSEKSGKLFDPDEFISNFK